MPDHHATGQDAAASATAHDNFMSRNERLKAARALVDGDLPTGPGALQAAVELLEDMVNEVDHVRGEVEETRAERDQLADTLGLTQPDDEPIEIALIAVDLVLFNEYNEVLVIRRRDDPFKGRWALPGGGVLVGEDLTDTAVREGREESSLDLSTVKLHQSGVYAAPGRDPRGRVISIAYAARGEFPTAVAGDDAAELAWVDPDTALEQGMAFDHTTILADALDLLYAGRLDGAS